jgi:hypothetical protein
LGSFCSAIELHPHPGQGLAPVPQAAQAELRLTASKVQGFPNDSRGNQPLDLTL